MPAIQLALGVWLVASTSARPDPTSTWLIGLGTVMASLLTLAAPQVRVVNIALGACLVLSALLPDARGDVEPLLHDAIIGTLIVLASLADRWFFDDR